MPALLAPRHWANHLLLVVLLVVAARLGMWQYDGWQARRDAEARDLTRVAPVALADAIGPDSPFPGALVGQPVGVGGTWVPDSTVFVSGREHDGRAGYWVVSGLVADAGSVLPVVRGWSATPADPAPPSGPAELVGWLQPPEGTGATDDDPADDVLPQLRIADLAQRFDQDLYGGYVVVADTDPGEWAAWPAGDRAVNDGVGTLAPADLQQLPDAGRFTALRNLLYAVEWWFFGAFAAFVWWRWARETAAGTPAGTGDPDGGDPDGDPDDQPDEQPVPGDRLPRTG